MSMPTQSRRQFLAAAGSTLAASAVSAAPATSSPVARIGLLADCQYADIPTRGSRFYRESPRKLGEAITELNKHDLNFSIHVGDLIDLDFKSFDEILPVAASSKSRLHHVLGNHDFSVPDDQKTKVLPKLGLQNGYYSFRHPGFRFLVLDTNEVSIYRHPKGTPEHEDATAEFQRLKKAGNKSAKPYSGGIGPKQLAWIGKELAAAEKAKESVLVFGHHPIMPNDGHSTWNSEEAVAAFRKTSGVKAYINGHNHAGNYADDDGIHYLTLDGMVETQDKNAFAHAALFPDRLDITGFGRQESHRLVFR